jgi:FixJ family two-component response regulator
LAVFEPLRSPLSFAPIMSDPAAISSCPKAPTIAVVDDDECMREALGNLLMSMGLEVRAFATAEDFLASPCRSSVACLVSDVQLPGMGGLELQRRIVADGNALPIILITAFPRDHVRRQAEQQGAVALLAKPFDGSRMADCIKRALQISFLSS